MKRYGLFKLKEEDCNVKLIDFYKKAAEIAGLTVPSDDFYMYDCRKICVSRPVLELIKKHYYDQGNSDEYVCRAMIIYGPKASILSDELVFAVEKGFIMKGE